MSRKQDKIQELKGYKNQLLFFKYNRQLSNEVDQKNLSLQKNKIKQKILTLYK